jgi:hypothetical protein
MPNQVELPGPEPTVERTDPPSVIEEVTLAEFEFNSTRDGITFTVKSDFIRNLQEKEFYPEVTKRLNDRGYISPTKQFTEEWRTWWQTSGYLDYGPTDSHSLLPNGETPAAIYRETPQFNRIMQASASRAGVSLVATTRIGDDTSLFLVKRAQGSLEHKLWAGWMFWVGLNEPKTITLPNVETPETYELYSTLMGAVLKGLVRNSDLAISAKIMSSQVTFDRNFIESWLSGRG